MTAANKLTKNLVTIDGPAASGKSSVSREVAARHGWVWVSTGAFYRGLAYVARQMGVNLAAEDELSKLADDGVWEVRLDHERTLVFFQGEDVTEAIHGEQAGADASQVSQFPKVRASLLAAQRRCAEGVPGLVAEGRDCGTVVFPNAPVKIYLTARQESRAQRRAQEKGESVRETLEAQVQRDTKDTQRAAAPLQVPEDAIVIDTSELDLQQVVAAVDQVVESSLNP